MYQYKSVKIEVESAEIEKMLIGAQYLCEGIFGGDMIWSLEGILKQDESMTQQENAYQFLGDHYATLQGALLTIGSVLALVNAAIINEDIFLTPGTRLQMRPHAEQTT